MVRGILVLALCGLGCSGGDGKAPPPRAQPSDVSKETLAAFDAAVEPLRQALDVPGVAVAIVKHGKTVFAKGYGLRDIESGEPVTTETVFRIGSITKSFSSTLVATLVDDGALTFETRAKDIEPSFQLPTAELTDKMTIHELLGMGTGLGEPNGFWWDYPTSGDLLATLPTLDVIGPEGTFLYNNEVYASGTYLALEAAKPSDELASAYARLMSERLFEPLGMSPAAVTDDPSTLGTDVAASYTISLAAGPGAPDRAGFVPMASVAPAGDVATNVTSLARFAAMQLAGGVAPDGTRVVSAENLAVTHAPQTHATIDAAPWLTDYAAGWFVGNEGGVPVVWHDGALDGYSATLRLLPDDDLALVVLTNGWNGGTLGLALEEELMQLVYGHADLGSAYYTDAYATARKQLDALAAVIALEAPIDPDAVAPLLGDWGHELSFELDDDNELFFVAPGSRGRVVRADKLFKPAGAYLVAGGPLVGSEVRVAATDGHTEFSLVDPASGDTILALAR
jgi:beta-lactamase class C